MARALTLPFGADFEDLYRREGLVALDRALLEFLASVDGSLKERLESARCHAEALPAKDGANAVCIDPKHLRRREGFGLTDPGTDLVGALDHASYTIWCHPQGKDSCSKGLRDKPDSAGASRVAFRKDVFGAPLTGCPLAEKVSEFQMLKAAGCRIGALAVIRIDNPMDRGAVA